jgi:hypothetical protein
MGHPIFGAGARVFKSCGEGGGLLGFAEEDAGGAFLLFQGWFEGDGIGDIWDVGAAGLLAGFQGYAAPAF